MRIPKFAAATSLFALQLAAASPALAQANPGSQPMFRVPLADTPPEPVAAVWMWEKQVGACSTTCGTGTRTTSYACQNAAEFSATTGNYGAPEADAMCQSTAGAKPASFTEACTVTSGCAFDWVKPAVQMTPVSLSGNPVGRVGCGQVNETFDPYCRRNDGSILAKSDHSFCKNDRPDYDDVAAGNPDALGFDRLTIQVGQCTTVDHKWISGDWSNWSSDCSTTSTRTRPVSCQRIFDASLAPDSACSAATRPTATEVQARYGSCSYSWLTSDWGAWNSGCSTTAQRTRTTVCMRSNGDAVPDSECTSRGLAKPNLTEIAPQYGLCSYSYSAGNWSGWSSDCSNNSTRTRTLTCYRSNGDAVPDAECSSRNVTRPTTSETSARYGSCAYSWNVGAWSGYSSTCSTAATRTRSVSCLRSNGDVLADSECITRVGAKPATSETSTQLGSCSYSAVNWSGWSWNSTCSSTAVRTRTAQCLRSDGAIVANSECTNRGIGLSESVQEANYSSCGYGFETGGWGGWSSSCSSSAVRTRSVVCRRSDGAIVPDYECTNRGQARPTGSESSPQYGGCSYSYTTGGWSSWNSTCSSNAARTRAVTCLRSDGTIVPDAECANRGVARPSDTEWSGQYGGCSYTPSFGSWSTCTNGTQTRPVTCTRSDGAVVAASQCGYTSSTETQNCGPRYIRVPVYYPAGGNTTIVTNFAGSSWGGEMSFYPSGYAAIANLAACVDTAAVGTSKLEQVNSEWFGTYYQLNFNNMSAVQAGFVDMGNCIADNLKYNFDPSNDWINWYQSRGNGVWALMTNQNSAVGILAPMGRIPYSPQGYAGEGYKVKHYNHVPFNYNDGAVNVSPQYNSANMPYWLYVSM